MTILECHCEVNYFERSVREMEIKEGSIEAIQKRRNCFASARNDRQASNCFIEFTLSEVDGVLAATEGNVRLNADTLLTAGLLRKLVLSIY